MRQFKTLLALTFIVLFIFTSCSKDEQIFDAQTKADINSNIENPKTSFQDLTDNRAKLAQEISCILSSGNQDLNKTFEKLCYATKEKGYYEQEFFFNLEKDVPQESLAGKTIAQILIEHNAKNEALLQQLCIYDPGLTLLLIGDADNPKYNSKVYYDNGFDDQSKVAEVPFYENCSASKTLITNVPKQKSFIVRQSETYLDQEEQRLDINQKTISMGNTCDNEVLCYVPITNIQGQVKGELDISKDDENLSNRTCHRDYSYYANKKENIYKFRARHDYDGGFNGSGEFLFYVIWADDVLVGNNGASGASLDYVKKRYDNVSDNNNWYYPNFDTIIWDEDDDGSRMKYILYEDDGGSWFNLNVSLDIGPFTVDGTIPVRNNDDFIGEFIVDWCDNMYYEYHPSGDVDVVINNR